MNKNNMVTGDVLKSLLIFAFPLLLSNIFQQLYNTMDTIIVGNHLGEISLAAIGASMAVFQLLIGFTLGFGGGFGIVIARFFGAEDEEKIKQSVAMSIIIGFVVVGSVMLISAIFLKPLLQALRTPVEIIEMAYDYIRIITIFVGVMFVYNLCSGLLRAIGNSFMPLVFLIISSLLNIALDIVFVVILDYGIKGAAIATVIAQGISACLVIIYIFKKAPILIPKINHFKYDGKLVKDLIGQGLSMALMTSIVTVGTIVLQYAINDMGYLIIAGHTMARRIQSLLLLPIFSIVLAISTFVSQNKGADQGERIVLATKYMNRLVIGWGIIVAIIAWMFSENLIGLMSGSTDELVIQTGTNYLRFNTPFYGILGVLLTTRFVLQGLGEKLKPLISSVIELVMKIGFVLVIIPSLGYTGVIISEPIIWIVMLAQLMTVYYRHPYIRLIRNNSRNN